MWRKHMIEKKYTAPAKTSRTAGYNQHNHVRYAYQTSYPTGAEILTEWMRACGWVTTAEEAIAMDVFPSAVTIDSQMRALMLAANFAKGFAQAEQVMPATIKIDVEALMKAATPYVVKLLSKLPPKQWNTAPTFEYAYTSLTRTILSEVDKAAFIERDNPDCSAEELLGIMANTRRRPIHHAASQLRLAASSGPTDKDFDELVGSWHG